MTIEQVSHSHDAGGPLLVLDGPGDKLSRVRFKNEPEILDTLDALESRVLWVRGESGIGKTSLLRWALTRWADEQSFLGVLRIECCEGLRLEEALFLAGDFLCQLGLPRLSESLAQRTPVPTKLRVLAEILRSAEIVIWLDDFQDLGVAAGNQEESLASAFAETWKSLADGAGMLVLTTNDAGPSGLVATDTPATVVDLAAGDILDGNDVWETLTGDLFDDDAEGPPSLPFDALPESLRSNPCALRLLAFAVKERHFNATTNAGDLSKTTKPSPYPDSFAASDGIEALVGRIRACLSAAGRFALDFTALHSRPMSRGMLRALGQQWEMPEITKVGLEEIERWGLTYRDDKDGQRVWLHPEVRRATEAALRSQDAELFRKTQRSISKQLTVAARRAHSIWAFYRSFRHLMAAEDYPEAYETHKVFLEEFIAAGLLGLVNSILNDCLERVGSPFREVLRGNLAIVYKNQGKYDEAIQLYEESLTAFTERGDVVNAARVHHQIGNTLYLKGEHDLARENYYACLDLAKTVDDRGIILMAKVQLANVLFSAGNGEDALSSYLDAITLAKDVGNPLMVLALHTQIAQIYVNECEYGKALTELERAEEIATSKDDRRNLIKIEHLRGLIAKAKGEDGEAVKHFESAAEYARALGDMVEHANCLLHVGAIQEERAELEGALRAYAAAERSLEALTKSGLSENDSASLKENIQSVRDKMNLVARRLGPDAAIESDAAS